MSKQSAVVIVLVALEANSIHNVTLKGHMIPLAKQLAIKTRSLAKYEILKPLAIQLIKQNRVVSVNNNCELDLSKIKRHQIRLASVPLLEEECEASQVEFE